MIVQMLPVMSVKGLFLKNKKGSNSMPDIWKHDPMTTNSSAIHLRSSHIALMASNKKPVMAPVRICIIS